MQEMKINRISIPKLDNLLGLPVKVLDHGFIRCIDYMGDDSSIVQGARVSYGKGTKTPSDDQGLINYLMRHNHTSPFELNELKIHVKLPVFVARQWVRHRTACLAGDVKVDFDLPGGIQRRGNQKYSLTMKEIFDRFQATENIQRPDKQKNPYHRRDRVKGMKLRSCDEDQLSPIHTNIVDIWESGIKPVLRVDFPTSVLRATKDHMCFTEAGWLKLGDALNQGVRFASWGRNEGYESFPITINVDTEIWKEYPENSTYLISNQGRVMRNDRIKTPTITSAGYQVVSLSKDGVCRARLVHHLVLETFSNEPRNGRETRHLNNNRQDNRIDNLVWGTPAENSADRMVSGSDQTCSIQWIEPVSWQEDGQEMTYDMEVTGPYHNFIAGGVIVHNSLNEYSARYSILKDEFYIPEPSRIAVQSSNNKQGSGETLSPEKAEEVRRILMEDAATAYDNYEGLSDPEGEYKLARELARINLPVNVYTEWYWKTDLHNLMHFLKLRADSHAQYEIRVYAEALCDLLRIWCPMTYNAFMRYKMNAKSFSGIEMNVLKELLSNIPLDDAVKSKLRTSFIEQGASSGEIKEFFQKLS